MILPGQLKAIIIVNLLLISVSNAIVRPPVPTITGASFDGRNMTVDCTVDSGAYDSVHVVLLTDFTSSLSYACEFGNGTGEGPVVNYASKSLRNRFPLSNQSRERYFVAAATSKINEDSIKIFSGWKVYTDNGLPVSITTSSLETCENLFYRARRINESNKNQVVFDVTFSLPVSRATNCKFILKKGETQLIDLPDLSVVPNAKSDLLDAIQDTVGITNKLFFMKTEKGINQYRFYGYLDNSSSDPIEAILIDTAGLVLDTLKNHVGVSSDNGYMNILSTIYALTAMPDSTIDPLNPGTIPSLSDSLRLKLLITAILDQ
ncbi:MAG TPA: hypothetical protein VHO70_02640, partial [Chitinispirillaceae bacterium]|nr:hypothetical protein [Chitinispirillaceae bacterium]